MRFSHKPYCTMTGLSKLYSSRSFWRDSSEALGLNDASLLVMSPGAKCMIKKEIKLMPISRGIIHNTRLIKYLSMINDYSADISLRLISVRLSGLGIYHSCEL